MDVDVTPSNRIADPEGHTRKVGCRWQGNHNIGSRNNYVRIILAECTVYCRADHIALGQSREGKGRQTVFEHIPDLTVDGGPQHHLPEVVRVQSIVTQLGIDLGSVGRGAQVVIRINNGTAVSGPYPAIKGRYAQVVSGRQRAGVHNAPHSYAFSLIR